ncbi:MAG: ABC transporter permease [Gemmatimonadota bacterium]|jgi:putative ABC transport system permease protein
MPIRRAIRSLIRRPGFTLLAAAALALGVGGTTAVFSLVQNVLLKGLPYEHPDRLVTPDVRSPQGYLISLSVPYYEAWSQRSRVFSSWGGSAGWSFIRPGDDGSQLLDARLVLGDFFRTLGLKAELGRLFTGAETERGAAPVVVLGHGFWQRAFGGDPNVIGKPLVTDEFTATIVGVLPPGAGYPSADVQAYVPMGVLAADLPWTDRQSSFGMRAIARLAPGATLQTAQADLSRVASNLQAEVGQEVAKPELRRLDDLFLGDVRAGLWTLMGAVGLLLLIACANVANLSLARGEARGRELAVRAALGAGRGRLVRLLLTESILLAVVGGAIGIGLAAVVVGPLPSLLPLDLPTLLAGRVALSAPVLTFALAVTALSAALFGLAPALRLGRGQASRLYHGARAGGGGGREARRLRSGLVVVQVALSLVLLVGAGLLTRSLQRLSHVDKGFDARNVITARLQAPEGTFDTAERRHAFYDAMIARLDASPDVESAAATLLIPLVPRSWERGILPDSRPWTPDHMESVLYNVVSPGYFRTMGIPLLRGRGFQAADRDGTRRVAVIDETMAQKFWPGENPIGRKVSFVDTHEHAGGVPQPEWVTVVGVAANVRHYELQSPSRIQVYVPMRQAVPMGLSVAVKHRPGAESAAADLLRRTVAALQPGIAISELRPLDVVVADALGPNRTLGELTLFFGACAVLLAAFGIFGVLSLAVTRRRQEIAVRMAVGATPTSVVRLVARDGIALAAAGAAVGLLGALAANRLIASLLFQVKPFDPLVYVVGTLVMLAVAAGAALAPAGRAARTEPARVLREE